MACAILMNRLTAQVKHMFFSKQKTILIIDDDITARKMMKIRFQKLDDYKVLSAGSGEKGLKIAKKEKPDVIILDWMMPVMNGLEVLTKLKRLAETRDIPVLMLTAKNKIAEVEDAFAIGAKDYITKPFSMGNLAQKVSKII